SLKDNSTPDRVLNSFESDNSLLDNFSLEFKIFAIIRKRREVERLINLMKNDVPDNSSNDPLLEEVDLFLSDDSIPLDIENVADDPEGDDNPSISRPPSKPPVVESFFDLKPDVIAEEISDKLNEDKCFDPG
nr:hypothetical protein [Tanacetum cinerariifolium]